MVSNQQWRLHNNQTKPFGDVVAKRWTHATVFDNGDVRQYMDGVLVNEDTYPNGTYTNIDLYKLGVNRRQCLLRRHDRRGDGLGRCP